ncbi:cupin domain-containing protein [Falsirhodobacter sp. 1013]|uniref:cupin domain-containing protein n=1 Tax=Falsirhodobacter sp. 1013 TaxID=3417566 RepID=UPI003EBEA5DF
MTDALSSVLSLLDVGSARVTRFEAAGDWAFRFPSRDALKFAAVRRGACWMVQDDRPPIRLETGDVFLLTHSPSYVLGSDPCLPPSDGLRLYDGGRADEARHGGDDVACVAATFRIAPLHERLLTDALPRVLVVRRHSVVAPALCASLELLDQEMAFGGMGSALMRSHLTSMMLIQLLRAFTSLQSDHDHPPQRGSWIAALADRRLALALDAMHGNPGGRWTVAGLAALAGMSRTSFAERFRAATGVAPMEYLLRLRMRSAEAMLAQGVPPGEVASRLGYGSASAFGAAFRRVTGRTPRAAAKAPRI